MPDLMSDAQVIHRVLDHATNNTTDLGEDVWREPVHDYQCEERFAQELELFKRLPMVYCPSAALAENGSYVARTLAGVPLVAVRGDDGVVRAFHNSCRHRGMMLAQGSGSARAFVCPYHAWAYALDGTLKNIPGELFGIRRHGDVALLSEFHGVTHKVGDDLADSSRITFNDLGDVIFNVEFETNAFLCGSPTQYPHDFLDDKIRIEWYSFDL